MNEPIERRVGMFEIKQDLALIKQELGFIKSNMQNEIRVHIQDDTCFQTEIKEVLAEKARILDKMDKKIDDARSFQFKILGGIGLAVFFIPIVVAIIVKH